GHGGAQGRDESEVDDVGAAVVDDDVLGLDVLVPETAVVVGVKGFEHIADVAQDAAQGGLVEAGVASAGVLVADDGAQAFAGDVGHDVVEAFGGELVLEDQAQLLGAFECAGLADDLREAGAVGDGEGLDDNAIGAGADGLFDAGAAGGVGFGDVEPAARTAAGQRADDGVSFESAGAPAGVIGAGGFGESGGDASFEAVERAAQADQSQGV